MSRNLARTNCYFCHGEVRCTEPERDITRDDAGTYYDEHDGYGAIGERVAFAECVDCEAKYLASLDASACPGYGRHAYFKRPKDGGIRDLYFRSTYNDEPGPEDMPKWRIVVTRSRVPWADFR